MAPYSRHPIQALGLAVIFELVLLVGAGVVLARAETLKPNLSAPVPIVLANEDQPPEPKLPEPKPPEPKPVAKPAPQPTPPPQEIPVPQASVPTAFTEPPPPAPPPPLADSTPARPSAEFAAKVRAAVKAAEHFPPAADVFHFAGRVQVEFHLRDGVPSEAHLIVASGYGLIDRAALPAVLSAHYPETPQEMHGVDIKYQVWIESNIHLD